jgi:diaminopimelate epimerase
VIDGLYKMEGAGNDFLVGVGEWADRMADDETLVRRLCDRHRGIGADGAVALLPGVDGRFPMVYRNADGGIAGFCANATRCVARAAVELLGSSTAITIATGWGEIPAVVDGPTVRLELPRPSASPSPVELPPAATGWRIVVGVPHLVVPTTGLDDLDLAAVAPPLRWHPDLGEGGANVNFFEVDAGGGIRVRSWERGVEGETLCCGSGVVAVALVVMHERGGHRSEVVPASGDRLLVEALGDPPRCATRLSGPAVMVAKVEPHAA